MTKYQVPDPFKSGFILVGKLSSSNIETLCGILNNINEDNKRTELEKEIVNKLKLSEDEATQLVRSLNGFFNLVLEAEGSIDSLIQDLANSIFNSSDKDIEKDRESLLRNLSLISKTKGKLPQIIKAYDLLSENERVYYESRVISDIRIVFDSDLSTKTNNAVVIHQLKLKFKHNGQSKEMYLTLDGNDLNELKDNINRAIEKEKLIYDNTYTKDLAFIKYRK